MSCVTCARDGPEKNGDCTQSEVFEWCQTHSHGGHGGGGCNYDQEAGALWDQRLKQYLLANGVAVINLNPITDDSWDNFALAWTGYNSSGQTVGGVDKPFIQEVFAEAKAGKFGPVDLSMV